MVSRETRARNPPSFSEMLDPCSQKNHRTRVKNVSEVHRIQCGDVKKGADETPIGESEDIQTLVERLKRCLKGQVLTGRSN